MNCIDVTVIIQYYNTEHIFFLNNYYVTYEIDM